MKEIVEQRPPRAARYDQNGLTGYRQWSILASSDFDAIIKLRDKVGVTRGTLFRDFRGTVLDTTLVCQDIESIGKPPAVAGGLGQYIVTAEYASVTLSPLAAQPGRPAVWTVKAGLVSTPVDLDGEGNPILTSALEPLNPPLTALRPKEILHGEFYVPGSDPISVYAPFRPFNGTVNADNLPRLGAVPGTLLCHVFNVEPSDTGWIKVTCDFEYAAPKIIEKIAYYGWSEVYRDYGKRKRTAAATSATTKTTSDKAFEKITGSDGKTVTDPVPLDGKGNPVTDGTYGAIQWKMLYPWSFFSRIPFPNGM